VAKETPESELKRLRAEQIKALEDEVFGGLSRAERAAYEGKTKRINQLEIELTASATTKKRAQSAKAEQTRGWNKEPETDTSQTSARRPYENREKDLANPSANSRRKRGKGKNEPDQEGGEQ
jgi:hypothetical protein